MIIVTEQKTNLREEFKNPQEVTKEISRIIHHADTSNDASYEAWERAILETQRVINYYKKSKWYLSGLKNGTALVIN